MAALCSNTAKGFEINVALDCDVRLTLVRTEPLKRDQLMREQRLHISAVQLRRLRPVVDQYRSRELMMAQHSRLLSYKSVLAMGHHYRP